MSFLDHRIKCGNSLVGVLDLDCLNDGIPDNAYKAVTGDNKKLSTQIEKENKQQCKNKNQLIIPFNNLEEQRSLYGEVQSAIAQLPENKTGDIKQKQEQYRDTRKETSDNSWWRDTSAMRQGIYSLAVEAANKLAKEKRFFHWALEFPEVFEHGGFSCVLGNPPWELLQIAEKEFFITKDSAIANAPNTSARNELIYNLAETNPQLLAEFEDAKYNSNAQNKFIRESDRFPLTAVQCF